MLERHEEVGNALAEAGAAGKARAAAATEWRAAAVKLRHAYEQVLWRHYTLLAVLGPAVLPSTPI